MKRELVLHPSLTDRQRTIIKSPSHFMLLTGPAGTAKTYTALARGLKLVQDAVVDRIVIIRSAVSTREIGFLPGSQEDKLAAFMEPYVEIFDSLSPKFNYKALCTKGNVEFHSTSFLRGMTFDNAYIVIDEYQNLTAHELETAVTRVGEDTHMVLCGDSDQSDLQGRDAEEHMKIIRVLTKMDEFEVHQFTVDEIVRSEFVRKYYEAKASLNG
jgi:predicted ribonuclease YlaK